ncbi:MAG: Uma2 family endonuclease [Treponema sp.]|nr:Uma2 family endonuclease [Treponema sp.]
MSDPMPVAEEDRHFTYADYVLWEGPERYQILGGEAFMMSSPTVAHQEISIELSTQFRTFLRDKPCRVFAAPLDVRLFPEEDDSDDTVVQPDLLVVCDRDKIGTGSVNGAPDLVVEISSPSNSRKEMFLKFQYYLDAGVREYWVIEQEEKKVQVHLNRDGHFVSSGYRDGDRVPVVVLPGLCIDLASLWAAAEGSA